MLYFEKISIISISLGKILFFKKLLKFTLFKFSEVSVLFQTSVIVVPNVFLFASLTFVIAVICVIDCSYFRSTQKISKNRSNQKLLTVTQKRLCHLHHAQQHPGVLACLQKVLRSFPRRTITPPVPLQTPRALK